MRLAKTQETLDAPSDHALMAEVYIVKWYLITLRHNLVMLNNAL